MNKVQTFALCIVFLSISLHGMNQQQALESCCSLATATAAEIVKTTTQQTLQAGIGTIAQPLTQYSATRCCVYTTGAVCCACWITNLFHNPPYRTSAWDGRISIRDLESIESKKKS